MSPLLIWRAYLGICRKQVIRVFRMWQQAYLPSAINTSLYMLIFGAVLGQHIGEVNGFAYMSFLTPGLIMMAVILNAYTNVVSSFFIERFMHTIDELMVSPTPYSIMIAGYITGGVFRGTTIGLVVAVICSLFVSIPLNHPILALITLLLTSSLFGLLGFINALFAKKFDDTATITTFVLTPLIYLGGVFYDETRLPPFWQQLSGINPIHYVIQLFRYSLLNYSPGFHQGLALIVLCGLNILGFFMAWALLKRGTGLRA